MTTRANAPSINEATLRRISQAQGEPSWLLERRLAALRAYEAMSMPDPLEEEWRRTDLSGFDLEAALASLGVDTDAPNDHMDVTGYAGRVAQQGSDHVTYFRAPEMPAGAVFCDLHTAAEEYPDLVQKHLHSLITPTEWKLGALQAAAWRGGAFVYVPRGVEVELPLRYALEGTGAVVLPHLLVIAEENSSVSIVQETISQNGGEQALVSGAVEIVAGPYARVRFVETQAWGDNVYNFSTIRARLDRGAEFSVGLIGLGGRLTRTKVDAQLWGEGSSADLLGLTYGDGKSHFNYTTLQDHVAPHTRSDLLFKAALAGASSEVWYGTVRVGKGGSGADASQTSRNLLLSDKAKAAPIPVLEIEAYDILRCSHGATAGPLDEEQRFYLESRGIVPADAQRLLVDAFFREVVDRLPIEIVKERVSKEIEARIDATSAALTEIRGA